MRGLRVSMHRVFFVSGLTLALGAGATGLRAQQSVVNPTTVNGQASVNGQATTTAATRQNPNPDLTNEEVARMDQFLDDHKNIQKELNANPSLINDAKYLDHHKDLQSFLDSNPRLHEEVRENPRYFMQREDQFESREGAEADRTRPTGQPSGNSSGGNANISANANGNANGNASGNANANANANQNASQNQRNPNPDLTRGELANFDAFLDSHPDISRQLEANPALINDSNYLQANPALQAYLTQHSQVREEITETPNYFMNRENRLEARDNGRLAPNPNNATAQEQDRMDQYLTDHKDVDRDLRKNPRLVDDSGYLKKHRDLDQFLRQNPDVRTQMASNPNYFQDRDRGRFDLGANARFDTNADRQLTKEQSDRMDDFMNKHQKVAKDLDHNPSLCNDDKYLSHHKDLRDFYDKNPGMRQQLAQNRTYFEERQQRFQQHGAPMTKSPAQTPQTQQAKPTQSTEQKPAQAPVDQRQNMTPTTTH